MYWAQDTFIKAIGLKLDGLGEYVLMLIPKSQREQRKKAGDWGGGVFYMME